MFPKGIFAKVVKMADNTWKDAQHEYRQGNTNPHYGEMLAPPITMLPIKKYN